VADQVNLVVEETLPSFIPSYKDVLKCSPLQVFSERELFSCNQKDKSSDVEDGKGVKGSKKGISVKKGVVFGGLDKDFSPIRTRSVRKQVVGGGYI
jgi:hypothetical protein